MSRAQTPERQTPHRSLRHRAARRVARVAAGVALAAAGISGLSACNPLAPVASSPAPSPTVSAQAAYQARILVLVNAERTQRGMRPLVMNTCADSFADPWAAHLAATGSLVHQSVSTIMTRCAARGAGENIAFGNVTADQMMTMWMNSPGHRANILNPAFTAIGIGAVKTSSGRWYGVQDFLTK